MVRRLGVIIFLAVFLVPLFSHSGAEAALNAVDPGPYTAATGFFPVWYQDTNGVALELCLSKTLSTDPAALGAPMCTLLAVPGVFNPALPIAFPGNFPDESFWSMATARVTGAGIDVRLVIGLEAAFATGVVINGDQVSFARVRFIGSVTNAGVYTITHPYGVEVINVPATGARALRYTRDIGIGGPGVFTGPLKGAIGPFLVRTDALGNPAPILIGTETFLGDPNVTQTVTGSPFGTNYFRIQGPGGIDIRTNLFGIEGKVFKGATLPTPAIADRTTYSRTLARTQMDVFATAPATAPLSFTTGVPPLLSTMSSDPLGRFFGQALVPPATLGPVSLIVGSEVPFNFPAGFPATASATKLTPVTDVVSITRAEYSIATHSLVIEASSSDETTPPALSYGASTFTMTAAPPIQSLTVTGLVIPPATVSVTSSAGGSDTEEVTILP